MAQQIFDLLRGYLAVHGYWTVALVLFLENMGLPVPGETVLLMASFLAYSEHRLHLPSIILVGIAAATIGDNLGFVIGHYGGRPLLERYRSTFRIKPSTIQRGEDLFARYGSFTVFIARFIAGMRIVTGPLAGVLRMPWRQFALFNFLGAVVWVTVIATVGYLFGRHWEALVEMLRNFNLLTLALAAAVGIWLWRRRKNGRNR